MRLLLHRRWGDQATRRRSYTSCMRALASPEQEALIRQLRAEMQPLRRKARSRNSTTWELARQKLIDHIYTDDPRGFLRWPEVRSTMFVAYPSYNSIEREALRNSSAWHERWQSILVEDPCGCPIPSRLTPETSDNLIHHAYHALTIEKYIGDISQFGEIVEFGGGYGSFARLVRRLGITTRYHIHDLPEFGALQRYYLASTALHRQEPSINQNLTWSATPDELSMQVNRRRLFLAFWSLSETPLQYRDPWYELIAACDCVVIAYQDAFEGVDNKRWFKKLQQREEFSWHSWPIPHMRGSFYLVGQRSGHDHAGTQPPTRSRRRTPLVPQTAP